MTWEEKWHMFVVSANEQAIQSCDKVSLRGKGEKRNKSSLVFNSCIIPLTTLSLQEKIAQT